MVAARTDLTIEQHNTFNLEVTFEDADGNAIDLTGYRIHMQIRDQSPSGTILLDLDSDLTQSGVTFGPLDATGIIDITVDPDITGALDFDLGVYDLMAIASDGESDRLIRGHVQLSDAITRD